MSKNEPIVVYATVRPNGTGDDLDIECRFSDGQKFAAVKVDGGFPELTYRIANFLSKGIKE